MSLTNTLSNALTGLNAASRQADLIANNLANALTEGYGRREIELGSVQVGDRGAGVGINGVTRISDPRATGVRRLAEADSAASGTLADAQQRLADALGLPGEPDSLASRADTLDAALAAAAETPENGPLLSGAVTAAEDLARSFRDAAAEARAIRQDADRDIARQVETLNASLTEIESLNAEIRNATQRGTETAALEDRRHVLIDRISGIVPLKVVQRDLGQVALFGKNGGQLLDGRAFPFEFTGTPIITPEMTLADGNLSGLTVNGAEQEVGTGRGFFDGGSLEASFAVRDRLVPEASARLDALAADLLQRVAQPSTDPSLGLVEPGLFTDAGAALDPTNIQGLSARIVINPAVNPAEGGVITRLRDGFDAVVPGEPGQDQRLRDLQDALTSLTGVGGFTGERGFAAFAAELSSDAQVRALQASERATTEAGRRDLLADAETNAMAVDSDAELARLLVVEQVFAANARVVSVVDELLERLIAL